MTPIDLSQMDAAKARDLSNRLREMLIPEPNNEAVAALLLCLSWAAFSTSPPGQALPTMARWYGYAARWADDQGMVNIKTEGNA